MFYLLSHPQFSRKSCLTTINYKNSLYMSKKKKSKNKKNNKAGIADQSLKARILRIYQLCK